MIPEKDSDVFCDRDTDIKEYLRLIVNCEISISAYLPGESIVLIADNCPADVTVNIEIRTACHQVNPKETAIMPKEKRHRKIPESYGNSAAKSVFKVVHFISVLGIISSYFKLKRAYV